MQELAVSIKYSRIIYNSKNCSVHKTFEYQLYFTNIPQCTRWWTVLSKPNNMCNRRVHIGACLSFYFSMIFLRISCTCMYIYVRPSLYAEYLGNKDFNEYGFTNYNSWSVGVFHDALTMYVVLVFSNILYIMFSYALFVYKVIKSCRNGFYLC